MSLIKNNRFSVLFDDDNNEQDTQHTQQEKNMIERKNVFQKQKNISRQNNSQFQNRQQIHKNTRNFSDLKSNNGNNPFLKQNFTVKRFDKNENFHSSFRKTNRFTKAFEFDNNNETKKEITTKRQKYEMKTEDKNLKYCNSRNPFVYKQRFKRKHTIVKEVPIEKKLTKSDFPELSLKSKKQTTKDITYNDNKQRNIKDEIKMIEKQQKENQEYETIIEPKKKLKANIKMFQPSNSKKTKSNKKKHTFNELIRKHKKVKDNNIDTNNDKENNNIDEKTLNNKVINNSKRKTPRKCIKLKVKSVKTTEFTTNNFRDIHQSFQNEFERCFNQDIQEMQETMEDDEFKDWYNYMMDYKENEQYDLDEYYDNDIIRDIDE